MKKINLITLGFVLVFNLYANENQQVVDKVVENTQVVDKTAENMKNMDKLDVLDKQSKDFFSAITGLEKDYLEEQVHAIKTKEAGSKQNNAQGPMQIKEEVVLSQEDYEKNVFTHQNEMARLTTDFTRTKKLKDLKIKSMYSFNGKDYVVLYLDEETAKAAKALTSELSANIEGRYIEGDNILGHTIVDINTRTKSMELYKKLDEEYGYTIYLSNYGISVSDLKKIAKTEEPQTKEVKETKEVKQPKQEVVEPIKKAFEQVQTEPKNKVKTQMESCLYTVKKVNLNVRNQNNLDGKILRVLKINDQFSINQKKGDWIEINTIYKKISGDVMDVSAQENWVQIIDNNVSVSDKNCM